MSKILVLAEKPSVGRNIASVLNCNKKENGYMEGNKYIVTWALGHLVTLAEPDEYNKSYSNWKIEDLPIIPNKMKYIVIKNTRKQYNTVNYLMKRKDVSEIVIATDAGREGELVARLILEKGNINKKIKRLWISSVTEKAIRDGFNNLRDGKEYNNLYSAALARAEADWIVGINATRALTCKHNAQLSCGRVQTPTIAIIAKREEEIKNFKPKKYYGIKASINGIDFVWQDSKTNDIKSFDKYKVDGILKSLDKKASVADIESKHKKKYSPKLYDLTELQRDANKKFDFSAKETLSIMQKLYEEHKVLTYPRTDSRYITTDIVDTLRERVNACSVGDYVKYAKSIKTINANSNFVDNKSVSDHHAIIPTEQRANIRAFSDRERKIYNLVIKRFFSVLYPPFEYEEKTIKLNINNESFIAKEKTIIKKGWKEIYSDNEDESYINNKKLSEIKKGNILDVNNISITYGETNPPSRFNEATLLSAMENPVKYMSNKDKELVNIIGETGGLGTVATRADIIDKLFNTFLLEKRGKDIYTTSKGKQLLDLAPDELKSPELTADWEKKLDMISKGKLKKDVFVNHMKEYTKSIVKDINNTDKKYKHDNLTSTKCPECGKYMLKVNGKKGTMLICQDRECGYKKAVSILSNARCPNCHKKLKLVGEGENKKFVCTCGYKEKLSFFNERKKKQGDKASKRDVNKFLNNQEKEVFNSSLANALKNFKK